MRYFLLAFVFFIQSCFSCGPVVTGEIWFGPNGALNPKNYLSPKGLSNNDLNKEDQPKSKLHVLSPDSSKAGDKTPLDQGADGNKQFSPLTSNHPESGNKTPLNLDSEKKHTQNFEFYNGGNYRRSNNDGSDQKEYMKTCADVLSKQYPMIGANWTVQNTIRKICGHSLRLEEHSGGSLNQTGTLNTGNNLLFISSQLGTQSSKTRYKGVCPIHPYGSFLNAMQQRPWS